MSLELVAAINSLQNVDPLWLLFLARYVGSCGMARSCGVTGGGMMLDFCVLELLAHYRVSFCMLLNILFMYFFW